MLELVASPVSSPPVSAASVSPGVDLDRLAATGLLIRSVEQRLLQLFGEGKLFGTVHTCIGQEWTGIAVAEALEDDDLICSNHRCHGHFLARTDDVEGLIAEIMGKVSGVCGGRGGSQHLCSNGFYSNGIQGGMMPVAAGMALAQKQRGAGGITVAFVGDGTLGEGALYEALNIAARWELPLLVVLENNLYAQSTPQAQNLAGSICARAAAFGIRTAWANTWAPQELLATARQAAKCVRLSSRPHFLQIDTYRLMAHSKGDDDRDRQEVEDYRTRDPLYRFIAEHGDAARAVQDHVDARIDAAVRGAEAAPYSPPSDPDEESPREKRCRWTRSKIPTTDRVVNRIHAGLQANMQRDARILLIGEDIEGPYGGAFKVTKNLSKEFPGRVRNTPISEAAIVGVGNGLALQGFRPVCEIMFGDFLALAADQLINHAAKFRYMYNDQVTVPLVVRTPMGGKRGYGATHSQSLEGHFLGIPGTRMLALHHRCDPAALYDAIFASLDCPTIVIENKALYAFRVTDQAPEGFVIEHTGDSFPVTRFRPLSPADVTLLCYGGMLPDAEKAVERLFEEHEVIAELVCPMQLYPLDPWPIVESVRKTGRLLIVEEGQSFAAFGAEVVAELMESAPGAFQRVRRLGAPRHAIPSCGPLEKALLPGTDQIVAAALRLVREQ